MSEDKQRWRRCNMQDEELMSREERESWDTYLSELYAKGFKNSFNETCDLEAQELWRRERNRCPNPRCNSTDVDVYNYDPMWHDGDLHCVTCGCYIRMYDAG